MELTKIGCKAGVKLGVHKLGDEDPTRMMEGEMLKGGVVEKLTVESNVTVGFI